MQFNIQFEGLLCWIPGKDNIFSDHASRLSEAEFLEKIRILLDDKGLQQVGLQKLPTIWTASGFELRNVYKKIALMSKTHRAAMDARKVDNADHEKNLQPEEPQPC